MMNEIHIPRNKRGRPTQDSLDVYHDELLEFALVIKYINSRLDFQVSARGWCYILEEYGLDKSDFNSAQKQITECRKNGMLPLNICLEDEGRKWHCLEDIEEMPKLQAESLKRSIQNYIDEYTPISFWEDQKYYLQMMVEKIDLRALFEPLCEKYHIPLTNTRGWYAINQRAFMMQRFKYWESKGKICKLLYCGDFDPEGVQISNTLLKNLREISQAVNWYPSDVKLVDRFGLDIDFINKYKLTWIEGLWTGSGKNLADTKHKDHNAKYVQEWLKLYGARKVESNALVVRTKEGRKLCEQAIRKYVKPSSLKKYEKKMTPHRIELLKQFKSRIRRFS